MKKLPRRMLVLTLSASLALTPAYAQASALPDTLQAEDATGQFTAVELSELKESLQQTLESYLSEHSGSESSLNEILKLTIQTDESCPITLDDCKYIEEHLPNLEELNVEKAVFADESAYTYFKDTEKFKYLYTENTILETEASESQAQDTKESETEAESQDSEESETEAESQTETQSQPQDTEDSETEAESEAKSQDSKESETKAESQTETQAQPQDTKDSETEAESEAKSQDSEESETEAESQAKTETEAQSQPQDTKDSETEAESQDTEESVTESELPESDEADNSLYSDETNGIALFSAEADAENVVSAVTGNTQSQVNISLTNAVYPDNADIYFAVWSENNDQDDIIWYLADRQDQTDFTKTIDIKNHHADSGQYFVHVYALANEEYTLLGNTSFNIAGISDADIAVNPIDVKSGIYRLTVSNLSAPAGISSVKIPVWSNANDQDDIVWYDATYSNGNWYADFHASNHKNAAGKYTAHVYAYDSAGNSKLCTYTEFDVTAPTVNYLSVELNSDKTQAVVSLSNPQITGNVADVYFPIWGDNGGQNDIVWYKASLKNGVWTAAVDLKTHKENGVFNVHAYVYNTADAATLVASTTFEIPQATAQKVSIVNKNDVNGSYQVKIDGLSVPFGVSQVLIPTWTSKNGQDDILWYEAKKEGSSWVATIDSGNHNFETGEYNSHIYVYDGNGLAQLLEGLIVDVKAKDQVQLIAQTNDNQTKMTVTLKNYRSNSSKVRFAVWGEQNGQNDLQWYEAKKSAGTYTYTVDLSKHKEIGRFNIHAYDYATSEPTLIRGISANVDGITNAAVTVDKQDNDYGTFTIKISGLSAPDGIQSVRVPRMEQSGRSG